MIERWEFIHFPCEKDPLRYKLKVKAKEEDLPALIRNLGVNCGRPFTSLSKDFNWAFYLYQIEKKDRNHIVRILKELTSDGSVQEKVLEMSHELPPILEEFLDETARTLITEEEKVSKKGDAADAKTLPTGEKAEQEEKVQPEKPVEPPEKIEEISGMKLNIRYLFENFIVGPNNRFTHAAARAVAENLGRIYNPLFIYGGVGLGKTHLMHAVGHYVLKKNLSAKVLYITTEKFMGEVIEAVGKGTMNSFHERFRSVNLLLIDDIQFLSESEATQQEFFHTFNYLHENGQQIIITSDRPPKQLATLEDRLRSRFEWGLIADIKSPALETRVAILKQKSFEGNFALDENMLLYIASKLKSNIRELEGFLKRINAYAELTDKTVDMDLVKMIMKELLPEEEFEEKEARLKDASGVQPPPSPVVQPESPAIHQPPQPPQAPPPKSPEMLPATIGFSVPAPGAPPKPKEPVPEQKPPGAKPLFTPGPAASKFTKEDIDPSLTPIEVGFFYPEGQEQELSKVTEKFKMIIKKHKLKFRLEPLFKNSFSYSSKINYAYFIEQCKTYGARILIVLGPPPEGPVIEDDFANLITAVMEDERISLQLVPWKERTKDYRYLNLALDMTLLRHRRPGSQA